MNCSRRVHAMDIDIDPGIFHHFKCYSGWVPAGYWANWLGVLTHAYVWAFPEEVLRIYSQERYENLGYPVSGEHVLDWVPLLEAVLNAGDTFVIASLGAGWGRWLSGAAFAARSTRRAYYLVGVEAEPEHFRWLETHLKENGIDPSCCRLINAAVAGRKGHCWFYVGKPASWYGQSIVSDDVVKSLCQNPEPGTEVTYEHAEGKVERLRRIRCVDLQEAVGELPMIDYVHLDVQGSELDVLRAHPELLQRRVKMVNVGTHSPEIETELRNYFRKLKWINRFDVPINTKAVVKIAGKKVSDVQFGDGVQVWVNPTLSKVRRYQGETK